MKRLLLLLLLLCATALGYDNKPMLGELIDHSQWSANGLVGCWLFNEGAGNIVQDASGNGNTGTSVGATWAAGPAGPVLQFDLDQDRVAIANYSILDGLSALSVVARFRSTGAGSDEHTILSSYADSFLLRLEPVNNSIDCYFKSGEVQAGGNFGNANVWFDNTWHTIVVTYTGAYLYPYIDGVVGTPKAAVGALDAASAMWIGHTPHKIGGAADSYGGDISYIYLYDRALTAQEVASLTADPYQMFGGEPVYQYAEAGEAPTSAPQVIPIIMTTLPAWMIVGLAIGFTQCRRRAA